VVFSIKPSWGAFVTRNEPGMTLVELLASLSLLGILLAVLSQFLYTGIGLWGKTDRANERNYQLRFISQTLNTDLASMVNSPFLAEPAISGDEYEVTFWSENDQGLVQVKYRYDESTQKVLKTVGFWGNKASENEVFQKIQSWKIEYYRPKTKKWESQWQPAYKNEIPALLRVTVILKNKDQTGTTLVFPIKTWHNESNADEK
jgi:prepilin-type N-terminal cleavage/methylation domain-containing protein